MKLRLGLGVFVACVALYPLVFRGQYPLGIGIITGALAAGTVGFVLLLGYAHQLALGQAGFCMVGGYASAILCVNHHWDPLAALLAGALVAMVTAWAIAAPILKLRGNWTVIDPAVARRARKRLVRTVKPGPALAATLTGVVQLDPADETTEEQVVVGASLLRVREQLRTAATRDPVESSPRLQATLRAYQRHGLAIGCRYIGGGEIVDHTDDQPAGDRTAHLIEAADDRRDEGGEAKRLAVGEFGEIDRRDQQRRHRRERGVDQEGVEDHPLDRDAEDAGDGRILRGSLHLAASARAVEEKLQRDDGAEGDDQDADLRKRN